MEQRTEVGGRPSNGTASPYSTARCLTKICRELAAIRTKSRSELGFGESS